MSDPRRLLSADSPVSPEDAATRALLARLPEPEPEDAALRERVWRALPDAPSPSPFRWLALPAVAMAALALVRWPAKPAAPARLELAAGAVQVAPQGQGWREGHAGALLEAASRLQTGASGRALVALGPEAALLLQPGTAVGLGALGAHAELALEGGELAAQVPAAVELTVVASRSRVVGHGAVFSVVEQAASETVSVARGEVEVVQGDVRFAVRAGQSWSSRAPAARGASQLRPADQQLLEGAVSEGPREQVRVESPVESQGGAAGEVTVRADGVELGPTPLTWQAPVGRHHLVGTQQDRRAEAFSVTSPGAPAQVLLAMIAPEPVRPPAPPPVPAPKIVPVPEPVSAPRPVLAARPSAPKRPPAPPPEAPVQAVPAPVPAPEPEPTPAPKPPEDRRYAAAVALARGGDHAEAAKALEALVEGGGAHADLALYELGRQKQRHLGDLAGADAAFRRYRATYPQGSLAQEVELSLIELEVARGRRDDALADLPRFLAAHPDSERAPEMQLLRATLLRQKGDCEAALAAYEGLARTPQVASEALYFTAWCQRKLGRADDAERSLRRYLTLYPKDAHAAEAAEALQAR